MNNRQITQETLGSCNQCADSPSRPKVGTPSAKLLNPEFYITMSIGGVKVGLWIVLFIVFAETGLFAGFFLPGDSLLFLAGIYSELLMKQISFGNDFANVFVAGLISSVIAVSFEDLNFE